MAMMKRILPGVVLSMLLAGLFLVGYWYGHRSAGRGAETKRPVLYYVDPMNPAHTSSEPGLAPCGMKMEPVYAAEDLSPGFGHNPALSTGGVRISPEKQQIIGVRTETVEQTLSRTSSGHWAGSCPTRTAHTVSVRLPTA